MLTKDFQEMFNKKKLALSDDLYLHGHLKIYTKHVDDSRWYKEIEKDNLIVTVGKTLVRDKLNGDDTTSYLQSFAFGTGTTSPSLSDTGLESAIAYDTGVTYKAFEEYTNDSTISTTYVGYYSSLEPLVQPVDITEVGLFTGLGETLGIMYNRATFDAITKTSALELRLEYILSF